MKQLERFVELHRKGVGSQARLEHQGDVQLIAERLRMCSSWRAVDNIIKGAAKEFWLVAGLDRIDLRSHADTPAEAAEKLEEALRATLETDRNNGGDHAESRSYFETDKVWITSDFELDLVAGAASIFKQWTGKLPTLNPKKPGLAFLKAVVAATDHRRISVERRLAKVRALLDEGGYLDKDEGEKRC